MKHSHTNYFCNLAPAVLAAVLLVGCATSKSNHTTESASAQPSGRTVILMPIVIMPPTDNSPPANNTAPMQNNAPPEQSVDGAPTNPPVNL